MGLLGEGAMVIWCDSTDQADHDAWHSHEHLIERLSVPGFRRGRRGVVTVGSPHYLVMYEVDDLTVLTSKPYLDRLNNPTPWTQRILPTLQNVNRSLCCVAGSCGLGVGTHLLTIRVIPSSDKSENLQGWLLNTAFREIEGHEGLIGASLLIGDQDASRVETEEKRLRQQADEFADWIILLDGYDEGAVTTVSEGLLSSASLTAHGAAIEPVSACYRIAHTITEHDVQ